MFNLSNFFVYIFVLLIFCLYLQKKSMTRINLLIPSELTDQHLIAEIKEINQLSGQFKKSLHSKNGINNIPMNFKLNTGHVKYFYNKGKYLHKRFQILKEEALNRGFNINIEFNNEWQKNKRLDLYNDWKPNEEDKNIVRERIKSKILKKPQWYKYKSKIIEKNFINLYNNK
jgi:deoxyribonuclease (pyrimidine dimer)